MLCTEPLSPPAEEFGFSENTGKRLNLPCETGENLSIMGPLASLCGACFNVAAAGYLRQVIGLNKLFLERKESVLQCVCQCACVCVQMHVCTCIRVCMRVRSKCVQRRAHVCEGCVCLCMCMHTCAPMRCVCRHVHGCVHLRREYCPVLSSSAS
jgi:hypothetical protein